MREAIEYAIVIFGGTLLIVTFFVAFAHIVPWIGESVAYSSQQAKEYFKEASDEE